MFFAIINKDKNSVLARKGIEARTFLMRFLGLMGRKQLNLEGALIFHNASSIHTCFMRFPLDLVFLDRQMKVLRIVRNLNPWRLVCCFGCSVTVEFASGNKNLKNTEIGDHIVIEKASFLERT